MALVLAQLTNLQNEFAGVVCCIERECHFCFERGLGCRFRFGQTESQTDGALRKINQQTKQTNWQKFSLFAFFSKIHLKNVFSSC